MANGTSAAPRNLGAHCVRAPGSIENGVLIGRQNHLFLAGGAHSVLDYVSGHLRTPESSYLSFDNNIDTRATYLKSLGISYLHVLHPDKQSVLLAAFPFDEPACLGEMYLSRCPRAAKHILYPRDRLREVCNNCFLHTDTHLSDTGGIQVASAVANRLLGDGANDKIDELFRRVTQERVTSGDLGSKLTPAASFPERYLEAIAGSLVFSNRLTRNNGIVDIWISPDALSDKRLLIFGDSFGRHLARMLSHFFSETVFLRTPFFHPEIADQIRPDHVITQNVERYLAYVEDDGNRPSFFMYPYLATEVASYHPDQTFGYVFSALLSYPRKPYQAYRGKFFPRDRRPPG